MAARPPAIGIDLGTTFSCVGVYHEGRVKILQNEHGNRITPSVVGFIDGDEKVGEEALGAKPEDMIYDVKRLIGRRFNEKTVQEDMKNWGFKVVNDNDKPKICISYGKEEKVMNPEEISASVLKHMRNLAEEETGQTITKAVITVPAYFDETQREATTNAAKLAGLEPLRLLSEPTAAAIAYELDHPTKSDINVLIYDLGGGTFDVSLLNIDFEITEVLTVDGDTHLGGQDFVNRLVDYLAEKINREHNENVENNKYAMQRLRTACERSKIRLSTDQQAIVKVTGILEGIDVEETFTREQYENMNKTDFDQTLAILKNALKKASLATEDIHEVVFVGGATRTPYIRKIVQEFFKGKFPCLSINPDEVVAYGAAVMAAKLNRDWPVEGSLLIDVTALSLGVAVHNTQEPGRDKLDKLIHRDSRLPIKTTKPYFTAKDYQTKADIFIYQGELPYAADNRLLGRFTLEGIPPGPRGTEKLTITFDLDEDGIIHVTAVHTDTGNTKAIEITRDKYHMEEAEIKRKLREAQSYFSKNPRKPLKNTEITEQGELD